MRYKKYLDNFKNLHWQFVAIASTFGFIFVIMTPPLWGADEAAHFFRAYQISQGEVFQKKVTINGISSNAGAIPKSFDELKYTTFSDIGDNKPTDTSQVNDIGRYYQVAERPLSEEARVANPYGSIIYSAITYTAPVIGMLFANLFNPSALEVLTAGRIATLILYIALASISLFLLRKTSVKWMVFVIALLPMSLYQATVISADSLVLGVSLLLFAIIYNIFHTKSRVSVANLVALAMVTTILVLIKPPYLLLVFVLIFLPLKKIVPIMTTRLLRIAIPVLCVLIAALGILAVRGIIAEPLPGTSASAQLHWIIDNPFGYLYTLMNSILVLNWLPQVIGLFGTSFIFIPGIVFQALLVLLLLSAYVKTDSRIPEKNTYAAFVYILASIIASLAVITTLYLTWTPIGAKLIEGIQGRYFLPMLAFALIGIRLLTKARLVLSEEKLRIVYPTAVSVCLVITQLWYYKILY